MMRRLSLLFLTGLLALLGSWSSVVAASDPAAGAASAIVVTSLTPNLASPQPLGTAVTWTAQASGATSFEYQFAVSYNGGAKTVVQDYSPASTFVWTAIADGTYTVFVRAQQGGGGGTPGNLSASYVLSPRVNRQPIVTATSNPLVALYSGASCSGGTVLIQFWPTASPSTVTSTTPSGCNGHSVNKYIAGMTATTSYTMQQVVSAHGTTQKGPTVTFTTGQPTDSFVPITVPVPASGSTATADGIAFLDLANQSGTPYAVATNLSGNVVWYYPLEDYSSLDPGHAYVNHPVQGGSVLVMLGDGVGVSQGFGGVSTAQTLREIDLAGNVLHQTTVARLNEQLAARGAQTIDAMHHEAVRFPNGHTLVLGYVEQLSTTAQGGTVANPVDILTDQIIDLDSNFQVDWTWNALIQQAAYITRTATLNEHCSLNSPGCPSLGPTLATVANDWTHSNAIAYSPADGNILLSERHQDWIVKINYLNATGDGHIIWRLGLGGDFTLTNPQIDPYPWFSHQHGIENDTTNGQDSLITFDDGNVRCNGAPTGTCDSRGQAWLLNETSLQATLSDNQSMGNYSFFLGWAEKLANGDYFWTSGGQLQPNFTIQGDGEEFSPSGTQTYEIQNPDATYRVYRLRSMYSY